MRHFLMIMVILPLGAFAQTIDECIAAAESNYPLIRQYDLIGKTTQITVENIQKGWLPQISATAQATLQSDVTAWPSQMEGMLQQMGVQIEGLKKDQYRVGVDIQQTLFDGGAISSRKDVARRQGEMEAARNEASIYSVRQRVSEMFFGLLLLGDQIQLNSNLVAILTANEKKLAAMYEKGTASESDYLTVKAERLATEQNGESLRSQHSSLAMMLSTFCGMEVSNPVKPDFGNVLQKTAQIRPELKAINAGLQFVDAQEKALDAALMPKLSIFASGYYGYPGYNMFEDMMRHRWSLNGMVGVRLQWNIGALYTNKNDHRNLALRRDAYNVERDVFLFNNNLTALQQTQEIERYRKMMATDDEIINIRSRVRTAAESKLEHGIIATSDLVKEIYNENNARVQKSIHEIEMLKQAYDLKITNNQ